MNKLYDFKFLVLLIFLLPIAIYSQSGGCPNVYAGEDVAVNCSDPCTTLVADYLETGETTSYSVSSIPYAPPFPFTGGTNSTNITADDKWSPIIDLGFDFCFFGGTYDKALINSNGALTFSIAGEIPNGQYSPGANSGYSLGSNSDGTHTLPGNTGAATDARAILGVFGVLQDTNPMASFQDWSINYEIIGNFPCRMLVLNYYKLGQYSCGTSVGEQTYQTILYETTNIIEVFVQNRTSCSSWENGRGLIGIQNEDATMAYSPPGRNTGNWSAQNEAWRFTPDGASNVTVKWYANGIEVGSGSSINVCVDETTTFSVQTEYTNCNGVPLTVQDTVTVTYGAIPEPVDLTAIDDDGDGFAIFDLTENNAVVLEGVEPTDYMVTYYGSEADAQIDLNPIAFPNAYQNIANPETIFVRLELAEGNCFAVDSFIINTESLSTNSIGFENLNVFPNPTSGNLKIQSSQLNSETIISVYDIFGKLLLTEKAIPQNGGVALDVSSFSEGIYFVKISSEGNEAVRKFIKK